MNKDVYDFISQIVVDLGDFGATLEQADLYELSGITEQLDDFIKAERAKTIKEAKASEDAQADLILEHILNSDGKVRVYDRLGNVHSVDIIFNKDSVNKVKLDFVNVDGDIVSTYMANFNKDIVSEKYLKAIAIAESLEIEFCDIIK